MNSVYNLYIDEEKWFDYHAATRRGDLRSP